MTHSAVSQNIKELNKQLGVKLFNSNNKGVYPTSDATELYKVIKNSLDAIREGEENLKSVNEDTKAVVKLSMPSSLASVYFKDFIKDFCTKFPNVRLEFIRNNDTMLLAQRKLDLAINLDCSFEGSDYGIIDLFTFNSVFLASKDFIADNKLKQTLNKKQLLELPLIGHKALLSEITRGRDFELTPRIVAFTAELTFALVKAGLGIGHTFAYALENRPDIDDIVVLKTQGLDFPKFKTVIAYNKGHLTRIAQTFIDELKAYCAKNPLS